MLPTCRLQNGLVKARGLGSIDTWLFWHPLVPVYKVEIIIVVHVNSTSFIGLNHNSCTCEQYVIHWFNNTFIQKS